MTLDNKQTIHHCHKFLALIKKIFSKKKLLLFLFQRKEIGIKKVFDKDAIDNQRLQD